MKRVNLLMFLILTSLTIGCMNSNRNMRTIEEEVLQANDIKENSIRLKGEEIEFSKELIHAQYFYVYKDSILIVTNRASVDCKFIEIYNMNTNKHINSLIGYGRGNKEMIFISSHINKNMLYIHDLVQRKFATVNLDSLLTNQDYMLNDFTDIPSTPFATNTFNDKLIYINPYYFKDEKMNIDNGEPLLLKLNDEQLDDDTVAKLNAFNVTQGSVATSKNRIITVSSSRNEMFVYNQDLELLKLVLGPGKLDVQYTIKEETNSLSFSKVIPYTYRGGYCATDEYVYFSYCGEFYDKNYKNFTMYILKFDWDGNFLHSYKYPKYVKSFSSTSNKDEFYASVYNDDDELVLIKLSL